LQTEKASPAALTGLNPWKLTRIQPARRLVELRKGAPMRSLQSLLPGRTVFGVVLVVVLAVFATLPAYADVRILSSSGGRVEDYLRIFAQLRASGERIIIDGPCLSACTLVLSTIPKNRICVTRRAVLGFHAAQWVDSRTGRVSRAPEATRIVIQSYPPGVRAWIKKRGGLSGKIIYLRGRELGSLYRRC
jgi:hypothetical protein